MQENLTHNVNIIKQNKLNKTYAVHYVRTM